jgi:RNA polymerase sigma-70 factor (ECF subfamily)
MVLLTRNEPSHPNFRLIKEVPMSELLSTELILLAKQGDPLAIEELVKKFRPSLHSYACHYLGNDYEAEDLTQEVLLKVIRGLPGFKGHSSITTWVFRIMANACIDYHRKRAGDSLGHLVKTTNEEDEATTIEIRDEHPLPDEEYDQLELRDTIKTALNKLSPEHRMTIILHDLHDFKYQEIADITAASLGTVKSRLFYGRQALRLLLEPLLSERGGK